MRRDSQRQSNNRSRRARYFHVFISAEAFNAIHFRENYKFRVISRKLEVSKLRN